MLVITTHEEIRAIVERANAERNATIRALFTGMFKRKPSTAPLAAQTA
jgi:hypothetical protein